VYIDRRGVFLKTIEIMRELVGFDTTSRRNGNSNSNMRLMNYVRDLINSPNIHSELVSNAQDEGQRANLIIRIGPEAPGGILFSGHTDVVTVDNQNWISDPWQLRNDDKGWYYGRGTADMKGFIACVLAMAPVWAKANLVKPIYIVLSYDEEVGCTGIVSALDLLKKHGINPDISIIGEPTEMAVVRAHKSRGVVKLICEGTGGHAAKINDPTITSAAEITDVVSYHLWRNSAEINKRLGDDVVGGPATRKLSWTILEKEMSYREDFRLYMIFVCGPELQH
jgi:acetylornithine deacetylase